MKNHILNQAFANGGINVKLRKCLSAVTAGAITISAIAVSQLVSADAAADPAAAQAYWGSYYDMAATDSAMFSYTLNDDMTGVIVTDYLGIDHDVRIPEEIDGRPVIEVDFSECMHHFKNLMLPDTAAEVTLASYSDLLTYYNTTLTAASINDFEYYYDAELKGVVITNYIKDSLEVKIPDKVKLRDSNDSNKVNEYSVKKVDMTQCDKELTALVIPDTAEEVIIPNHEDIAIRISDLKSTVSRSSSGKKVTDYIYTNIGVVKTNLPAQLEEIETGNFTGAMIRSVFIPDTLDDIGQWAFSDCYMLTDVVVANENTTVGEGAFRNCYQLTEIDMGNLDSIGDWAFSGCAYLKEATLSEELDEIGKGAFSRCVSLASVNIPASVKDIGEYAFHGCDEIMGINVAEGNGSYVSVDGVLFDKSMKVLLKYPEASFITDYTIPDGVNYIATGAFRNSSVESLVVPESVSKIGYGAFENCTSLRTLTLPNSVNVIEPGAFEGCTALKVTFKSSVYGKNSGNYYDSTKDMSDLYYDINTTLF